MDKKKKDEQQHSFSSFNRILARHIVKLLPNTRHINRSMSCVEPAFHEAVAIQLAEAPSIQFSTHGTLRCAQRCVRNPITNAVETECRLHVVLQQDWEKMLRLAEKHIYLFTQIGKEYVDKKKKKKTSVSAADKDGDDEDEEDAGKKKKKKRKKGEKKSKKEEVDEEEEEEGDNEVLASPQSFQFGEANLCVSLQLLTQFVDPKGFKEWACEAKHAKCGAKLAKLVRRHLTEIIVSGPIGVDDFGFDDLMTPQKYAMPMLEAVALPDRGVTYAFFQKVFNPENTCVSQLLTLDLNGNTIEGDSILLVSRSCHHLQKLSLSDCDLHHDSLQGLSDLKSLTELDLSNNERVKTISHLEGCRSLAKIDLANTGVKSLEPLAKCESLQFLSFYQCPVEELPAEFSSLPLVDVNAARSGLGSVDPLGGCQKLKSITISKTKVSDILPLAACPCMEKIIAKDMEEDLDLDEFELQVVAPRVEVRGPSGTIVFPKPKEEPKEEEAKEEEAK